MVAVQGTAITKQRRQYTPEFKRAVVLEGLRGDKSIAQLCRERDITDSLYYSWCDQFLQRAPSLFAEASQSSQQDAEQKSRVAELAPEGAPMVGKLTLEHEVLKKQRVGWVRNEREMDQLHVFCLPHRSRRQARFGHVNADPQGAHRSSFPPMTGSLVDTWPEDPTLPGIRALVAHHSLRSLWRYDRSGCRLACLLGGWPRSCTEQSTVHCDASAAFVFGQGDPNLGDELCRSLGASGFLLPLSRYHGTRDITYIRLGTRCIYWAVILDAYTRSVRGWVLSCLQQRPAAL
jgi:transposase